MTSSFGVDRHLSYAHLLTHFFKEAGIDLTIGGAPLSTKETVGSATLHAMNYCYFQTERGWIRLTDIPAGVEYGGYESPHDSDSDDEGNDGQHTARNNEEVHLEIPAPQPSFEAPS
ncbi:hypothetical protein Scep_002200 [Stephania cephalantha]|uniref:Uncharacterized protein n=1 Tax=Stephania cephalantha TaxID=152367 RepID=A0AAP0LDH9_9MAGN